ncbi:4Fe-4S binding protein [uncultured Sphaerochaeta sp.]|uniref:4Fe-4S binding protein n=1 Tax=uncultured Sphaerochaeta sp. TaxID=886478 RepID=UPI002A0A30E2|nr:4Fe-4S binding protein [uncultured Sphaerochaeta sp.]
MRIAIICFSPTGQSKACSLAVAEAMKKPYEIVDVTLAKNRKESLFFEETLLIISFPVYAGRVPTLFSNYLEHCLFGKDCHAIAIATYGNRDYDDALVEIKDLLESKGILLTGAAAIVAQHSFSNEVGLGRPDAEDFFILDRLAVSAPTHRESVQVNGNHPFREGIQPDNLPYMSIATDNCIHCGMCQNHCPTEAIFQDDPSLCIHCCACIRICSHHARAFVDERFLASVAWLENQCKDRKKSELFIS